MMFGFLLRKSFYDLWDNLFRIALINLGFVLFLAFPVFIPSLLTPFPVLGMIALIIGILWCFVYLSAAALSLKAISDYGTFGFEDFLDNLKTMWPFGLGMGVLAFFGYYLLTMVIPFYLGMASLFGLLLAAFTFWVLVVAFLSLQFFFAIRSRLETNPVKALKKCFIIFFDNPLFSIFSLFHNLFILGISVFLIFLFPGPAGALLFLDEGLRLRLMKYDWLQANPEANRKDIPWDAILIDEREKTGTRSLKSFIFPWKD